MNKKFLTVSHILEYSNPDVQIGDTVLVGKWKNSPATIKSFETDKNNQPVIKTNKGKYSLYRFRIKKLMNQIDEPK